MANKKIDKKDKNPFAKLTWEDLNNWAGSTIVERGRAYKQGRCVTALALTPTGALIAWVHGTEKYATTVEMREGQLVSACNCPYESTCKHAVAVVLEYLDSLKNNRALPEVQQDDKRLQLLEETDDDYDDDYYDDDDDDDDDDGDDGDNDDGNNNRANEKPITPQRLDASLQTYLESQTQEQLINLIEQMASQHPAVKQTLEDMKNLKTGKTNKVVQQIRNELSDMKKRRSYNRWSDSDGPDWNHLKAQLTALLQSGHANEILEIGKELVEASNRAIESYDEEGEVGEEAEDCMNIVFQALAKSSLSAVKQLQWLTKMESADEFGICSSGVDVFWQTERTKVTWNELANELQRLLDKDESDSKSERDFSRNYKRDRLANRLISTLEKAGRPKEIIPLCEREAVVTGSYERLVDLLIKDKRWPEAEQWCRRGIEGITDRVNFNLRNLLYTINQETGNYLVAAALKAEEFFADPQERTFQNLNQAAKKAGVAPAVEAWARHYLETGEQPTTSSLAKPQKVAGFVWPLPTTGLKNSPQTRPQAFPVVQSLIDIAITEKKPDQVLKWFDHLAQNKRQRGYYDSSSSRVAEAIKVEYPDRAIAIWKQLAEEQIARTEVKAYHIAGDYLQKVRDTLISTKREKEWQSYLAKLQVENKRKPRCMQVLEGISRKPKPIIEA